jgi:hypothetical protein
MMTRQEATDLFHSDDLIGIGMAADAVRHKLHPHGIVSYIIDRNINYTNFCTEFCSFCAFYRPMGHAEGYIHPKEVIFDKIQETIDLGGTGILMQGGLHPEPAPLHQGAIRRQNLEPLFFGAGNCEHSGGERADAARHHRAAARRWFAVHSRRRGGDSG